MWLQQQTATSPSWGWSRGPRCHRLAPQVLMWSWLSVLMALMQTSVPWIRATLMASLQVNDGYRDPRPDAVTF